MVRHVVLWTLKSDLSQEEKTVIKKEIKEKVEALKDVVPGILELKVMIEGLSSSNNDLMLDSLFETEEALKDYQAAPVHVEIAQTKVKPFVAGRSCYDYEI